MGARSSIPLAPNDAYLFYSAATNVSSSPFSHSQVVHCCKPFCHFKHCHLALPPHPEISRRISQDAWKQLNADLVEDMYQEAPHCTLLTKNVYALCLFNLGNHRALYKVIAHYNRHLFHPMLIDAQIYAFHNPRRVLPEGSDAEHKYFVGFLIADTLAEFHAFPRPQPGLSTGYVQICLPADYKYIHCCPAFPDFHIEIPMNIPPRVPTACPKPPSMYQHTEAYMNQTPVPTKGCDCCVTRTVEPTSHGLMSPAAPGYDPHSTGAPSASAYSGANYELGYVPVQSGAHQPIPVMVAVAVAVPSASTNYSERMSKHAAPTLLPSAPPQSMKRDR